MVLSQVNTPATAETSYRCYQRCSSCEEDIGGVEEEDEDDDDDEEEEEEEEEDKHLMTVQESSIGEGKFEDKGRMGRIR